MLPLNLSVLVADDWPDSADSLAIILRHYAREVHVAYDGLGALAVAADRHIDAALLDIRMPGADGLEVARRLALRLGRRPLLVAVSEHTTARTREDAVAAGFDDFVPKPVDADALVALLARHAARLAAGEGGQG